MENMWIRRRNETRTNKQEFSKDAVVFKPQDWPIIQGLGGERLIVPVQKFIVDARVLFVFY